MQDLSNLIHSKSKTKYNNDSPIQQKLIIFYNLSKMPKQTKKQVKKVFQLLTTPQSNAYKQQVKKQSQTLIAGSNIKLDNLMQTNPDANYLSIFKKSYNRDMEKHPLDQMVQTQYLYDQKAKRDRHFNKKQQGYTKDTYQFPLTANQQYGWRQPIDTIGQNFGMKQTFDQKLMLTMKGLKQPKKA